MVVEFGDTVTFTVPLLFLKGIRRLALIHASETETTGSRQVFNPLAMTVTFMLPPL